MSEKERIEELAIDRAVGVLEDDERRELEALIGGNAPDAADAVAQAEELAAALTLAAEAEEPPITLRSRVFQEIDEPETVLSTAPAPSSALELAWWQRPAVAWAVAGGVAVFAVIAHLERGNLREQGAALAEQRLQLLDENRLIHKENSEYRKVLEVLSAAETRAVSLEASENASVHVYWHEDKGLVLAGERLPIPPDNRTFQLWVIPKGGAAPVSVNVFNPEPDGSALIVGESPMPIEDAEALAITEEPPGGAPQPTTTPIWVGPVG